MFGLGQMGKHGVNMDMRPALAQQLIGQGLTTEPVQHWAQGLGRLAQTLLGAKFQKELMGEQSQRKSNMAKAIEELMTEKVGEDHNDTLQLGQQWGNSPVVMKTEDVPSEAIVHRPPGRSTMAQAGAYTALNMPDSDERIPRDIMGMGKLGKHIMAMHESMPGGMDPSILMSLGLMKDNRSYAEQLADKQYGRARTDKLADMETKFGYDKELMGMRANQKTTDQRNWELAQKDPDFKSFLMRTGMANTPATIQEWNLYSSLPADKQEQFLTMKRAGQKVDLGGSIAFPSQVNPAGPPRAVMTKTLPPQNQPGNVAAAATAKEQGKAVGEARAKLPQELADTDQIISLIDDAISHPGRKGVTGMPNVLTLGGLIPGTDEANYRALANQLKGSAFLQAFQKLKGGGHITEIEGEKATQAAARLSESQTDEEYANSLRELQYYLKIGKERALQRANPNYKPKKVQHYLRRPYSIPKIDWDEATDEEKAILSGGK